MDPNGHIALWVCCMLVGMATGLIATAVLDNQDDNEFNTNWKYYLGNTLAGGLIGIGVGLGFSGITSLLSGTAMLGSFSGAGESMVMISGGALTLEGIAALSETLVGCGILGGIGIMLSNALKNGGYSVKVYPNDHQPPHCHLYGDDIANIKHGIRVGLDGNSLNGEKINFKNEESFKKIMERNIEGNG